MSLVIAEIKRLVFNRRNLLATYRIREGCGNKSNGVSLQKLCLCEKRNFFDLTQL